MRTIIKTGLIGLVLAATATSAPAQWHMHSVQDGNWNWSETWSEILPGTSIVPGPNDTALVLTDVTVTGSAFASFTNVSTNGALNLQSGSLNVNALILGDGSSLVIRPSHPGPNAVTNVSAGAVSGDLHLVFEPQYEVQPGHSWAIVHTNVVSLLSIDVSAPPDVVLDVQVVPGEIIVTVTDILVDACSPFAAGVPAAAGDDPDRVVAADLNGDGVPDLAVAKHASNDVSILLGVGDGTFGATTSISVGLRPTDLAAADLDGNGSVDLVATCKNQDEVAVLLGVGDGTFLPVTTYPALDAAAVAIGDLDGDTVPDLLVADRDNDQVAVLLGLGGGAFGSPTPYAAGDGPLSVALADFDGDGVLDMAEISITTDNMSVRLGNGDGTFGAATIYAVGDNPRKLVAADLDGDGVPDLAVANGLSPFVTVRLGVGDGTFAAATNAAMPEVATDLDVADVDADGILDLLAPNIDTDSVWVLPGLGDGSFGTAVSHATGNRPRVVLATDLDGDDKPDLVVTNGDDDTVSSHLSVHGWAWLGGGLAGTNGVPRLTGSGCWVEGATVDVLTTGALPGASAPLVVGFSRIDAPFYGGTMVPAPDLVLYLVADGSGETSISFELPPGLPADFHFWMQSWVYDPGAIAGFAGSNALRVDVE